MKIAEKHLETIEVEITELGFIVWVTEKGKLGSKKEPVTHWILDASLLRKDGEIRLGNPTLYKVNAEYFKKQNTIYVTKT
jgi:hypothetical protein